MKVVITGGFGFLGQQLCRRILALGELAGAEDEKVAVSEVLLFDKAAEAPAGLVADSRVRTLTGDISDAATCRSLVDRDGVLLFHLASVMSGQGEADFDLCMKVNLQGTQNLLEACRARKASRFVFCSSGACFGERPDGPETDGTKLLPYTTYGMTKAVCELLINDYSRRGFLDGRCARLPTVIPRPEVNSGLPAAYSAVIREPMKGQDVVINVDPEMKHAVCGFRSLVRNLLHLAQLPEAALSSSSDRTMNMPCLSVSCRELHEALKAVVAEPEKLGSVEYRPDPAVMEKLREFHHDMDATRARSLGMLAESSAAAICTDFAAEYVDAKLLRPVLEIHEEPRHCLVLANDSMRVFRTEFTQGDSTLTHVHRVDSLYFFLSPVRNSVQKLEEAPCEDACAEGEVRYGTHCSAPLVHRITLLKGTMFCLDIELLDFARRAGEEPPSKRPRPEALCPGLELIKERPGARVYALAVPAGGSWSGNVPFGKAIFVVRAGARTRGTFGDALLRPADVFFREGPLEVTLEVSGRRGLALWVVELL